jgi:hypothetical protein
MVIIDGKSKPAQSACEHGQRRGASRGRLSCDAAMFGLREDFLDIGLHEHLDKCRAMHGYSLLAGRFHGRDCI